MTGLRRSPCATPHGRLKFGYIVEFTPLTGHEPKTCIDVSSEHTQINHASRKNSLNFENDLTTTVPASVNSDGFPQRSAASGSQQQASPSVVSPWLSADLGAPGNWCEVMSPFQVLRRLCREGKRDRDLESVQSLYERRNRHVYFEQKAELAVQGECAAQKRLSEAEAEMLMLPSMIPIDNSNLRDGSFSGESIARSDSKRSE